jgi:hypothetical protein
MDERQNTIVCQFPPQSPKLTAFDIHEWIHDTLQLPEDDVIMVQTDGPTRSIYIKFVTNTRMEFHLPRILGHHEFKHPTDEITQITVKQTGLGYRSVRLTGLPPEVNDTAIATSLSRYGDITFITEEFWSSKYR